MSNLEVVHQQEVLGQGFKVYGTMEEPLFLAQDVANWIEIKNASQMLNVVDEDEKALYTIYRVNGSSHKQWFLTEDGIYEVLMASRKPIAKQWKKEVKRILKNIRLNGFHHINKERELILLPELEMATSQQVADFYGVDRTVINRTVMRHEDDFVRDGYISLTGKEIKEFLFKKNIPQSKIQLKPGYFMVQGCKITYGKNALFTKRAALRVGLIIRNSESIKVVRDKLLDTNENETITIKKEADLDHEEELKLKLGQAIVDRDVLLAIQITQEIEDYKNRHVTNKADKLDLIIKLLEEK